jgi:MFS family permease
MPKILNRDFILACFVQLAASFVFYLLIPTLPIYLSRLGSTEVETGVLIGVFFFCSLVLRPFVGKGLLKTPEKKFMLIGSLLYALASAGYLLTPSFWPFLIVRVIHGIGYAFMHTASITFVANISSEGHRGQSVSYFYVVNNISAALAPPLGMFLINDLSFTFLFMVCLGVSLCSLVISNKLGVRKAAPLQDSIAEGSFFLSRKALPPSITSSIVLSIWGAIAAFFPLYALDCGVTNPGLFFTTMAMMLILVRALGGKILDTHRKETIILPCLIIYVGSMVLLSFSKTLPMFILVAIIWGLGHAFLIPTLVALVLDRVPSSPGPAMGTYTAVTDLGLSLGPVIMGVVVHSTSYPTMFLCLAFTGLINLIHFYFFVLRRGNS